MIITSGCPIYTQLDGIAEGEQVPTETLLYWQQMLDCGDGAIKSLEEFPDFERGNSGYTHRFFSETGGVFHVTVGEGERHFPGIGPNYEAATKIAGAIKEMEKAMSRLLLANQLLEARLAAVEGR